MMDEEEAVDWSATQAVEGKPGYDRHAARIHLLEIITNDEDTPKWVLLSEVLHFIRVVREYRNSNGTLDGCFSCDVAWRAINMVLEEVDEAQDLR